MHHGLCGTLFVDVKDAGTCQVSVLSGQIQGQVHSDAVLQIRHHKAVKNGSQNLKLSPEENCNIPCAIFTNFLSNSVDFVCGEDFEWASQATYTLSRAKVFNNSSRGAIG